MHNEKISIAIIFTCYNREEKTRACIRSLRSQTSHYLVDLDYYICDDGSTDDTYNIIKTLLPYAQIVKGDGHLFWVRGMHKAMQEAVRSHHDFYLMINDDVEFNDDMFDIMLDSYYEIFRSDDPRKNMARLCGIVGSTLKKDKSDISYGGWRYIRNLKIGRAGLIRPNGEIQICDIANWNCFMIPERIIQDVGLIDPYYHHSKGDFDYSMMMKRKGYHIYIARDYIGMVDNNEDHISHKEDIGQILKRLFSVKGIPPKYEFYYFTKNWGLLGFLFFFYSFPKTIVHDLLSARK